MVEVVIASRFGHDFATMFAGPGLFNKFPSSPSGYAMIGDNASVRVEGNVITCSRRIVGEGSYARWQSLEASLTIVPGERCELIASGAIAIAVLGLVKTGLLLKNYGLPTNSPEAYVLDLFRGNVLEETTKGRLARGEINYTQESMSFTFETALAVRAKSDQYDLWRHDVSLGKGRSPHYIQHRGRGPLAKQAGNFVRRIEVTDPSSNLGYTLWSKLR